jgi:hypothetical protein
MPCVGVKTQPLSLSTVKASWILLTTMQFNPNLLQYSIVHRKTQTVPDEEEYDPREQSKQLDPPERTPKKEVHQEFLQSCTFGNHFQNKLDNVLK